MTQEVIVSAPPFDLAYRAKEFWIELFTLLSAEGRMASVDRFLLARYCEGLGEWEELNAWRKKNDVFIECVSNRGATYMVKHPKISRLENLDQQLPRMEKSLGIGRGKSSGFGPKPTGNLLEDWLAKTLGRDRQT